MSKRIFAFLLLLCMLFAVSCSDNGGAAPDSDSSSVTSSATEETGTSSSDEDPILPTDDATSEPSSSEMTSSEATSSATADSGTVTDSHTTDSSSSSVSTDTSNQGTVPEVSELEVFAGGVGVTERLSGNLVATSVCTLRNLPVGNAVQRFSVVELNGDIYIFTTQRSGTTTYLSRCRYNPKNKIAVCLDSITLTGYGHGESLEVRVRDGKFYVYVASRANPANDYAWGTEVTRFVYRQGKQTEIKTLTDFQCATATGAPVHEGATAYRVNFSFNEESDRFLIYSRCDTNGSGSISHYFTSFRLSELDRLLDNAKGTLSFKDCTSAFLAHHGKVSYKNFCPHGSFQGMDVCADGTTVYISGGAEGQQPQVYRIHLTDTSIVSDELCNITEVYANRIGMDKEYITHLNILPEIESFQQFNGRFYVSFNPGSGLKKNSTEIFVLSLKN